MDWIQTSWLLIAVSGFAAANQPTPIADLIARLGAQEFRTREQASAALEQQGEAALPSLRRARAETADPEVRVRAERLIEVIEQRNRARHALQQIVRGLQQSKEPPNDQQLTSALYLAALGRPATAEERQQGEQQLKAGGQRDTLLAGMIDRLRQHAEYSKPLAEARLQMQEFRVEMAGNRDAAWMQGSRSREPTPMQKAARSIMKAAEPLDARDAVDLLFLLSIARLPTAQEFARIDQQLKLQQAADRRSGLSDLWWALLNSNEFLQMGQLDSTLGWASHCGW
ncbi:MAG: hypothetical protein JNM56_20890 [Planctomycetia bacterium]|nr:hypothetical protein [Planctomycetia bacterium]